MDSQPQREEEEEEEEKKIELVPHEDLTALHTPISLQDLEDPPSADQHQPAVLTPTAGPPGLSSSPGLGEEEKNGRGADGDAWNGILGLGEEAEDLEEDPILLETPDGILSSVPRPGVQFCGLLREALSVDPQTRRLALPSLSGLVVRLVAEWLRRLAHLRRKHSSQGSPHAGLFLAGTDKAVPFNIADHSNQEEFTRDFRFMNSDDVLSSYVLDLDMELTFKLQLAAHYLDIPSLLLATTAKMAFMLTEQTPQGILRTFGIRDFTPEEVQQLSESFQNLVPS